MSDWAGLALCLVYVFGVIGAAEGLRRWRGYSSDFTRKVIHIGVGMLSWWITLLFATPWPFVAACLAFAALNLLDWRYGFLAAMASSSRANLGTVYFPLAAAVAAILLWDTPPLLVAALMPLTWGDGLALVVGAAGGRRPYTIGASTRTLEGSAAFFGAALLSTWLALWLVPGPPPISAAAALLPALVVSAVTALIEAVSPWGLDNLTVTAAAIAILSGWQF